MIRLNQTDYLCTVPKLKKIIMINIFPPELIKQAEAEVVPSSSLVEIEVEVKVVGVEVEVEVGVDVGVEVEVDETFLF